MYITDILSAGAAGTSISLIIGWAGYTLTRTRSTRELRSVEILKMEKQLPGFLGTISSSLEAGNSLQQSIETALRKGQPRICDLFHNILLRVRSGMTLDASLSEEAGRLPPGSLSLALISMASSYRSGSNMIESLALLSALCRERDHLRRKIMARTAQSRMQGYVLIFVPVLFMLVLFIVSPRNMIPVLESSVGKCLLGAAAGLQLTGAITIQAMLRQDIL